MKIIAITGKAQTGKGVVAQLLQHHLMMKGKRVFVLPMLTALIYELLRDTAYPADDYYDLLFDKERLREELQEIGVKLNEDEDDSVLSRIIDILDNCIDTSKYDYILLDSWRSPNKYKELAEYCRVSCFKVPYLIKVESNRDGIKGSGLENHVSEGEVTDWPPYLVSIVHNNKFTSYSELSMNIEHIIQTWVI